MADAETRYLVWAEGLAKQFSDGTTALGPVDLSIAPGEFVSLVGPSGCGKSTLLRLIAGLLEPSSGVVELGNRDDLAYVFQDPTLLSWRTVQKNVALPLELKGGTDADIGHATKRAIDLVGLQDFSRSFPWQLSGGMRMRVSLARALARRPELLLLDEPFGALDEITRQRLNDELLRLWQQDCWTGIFVTHNVYEAAYLSQRILVMSPRPGRFLADLVVPFSYPRTPQLRASAEFVCLAEDASRHLAGEGS